MRELIQKKLDLCREEIATAKHIIIKLEGAIACLQDLLNIIDSQEKDANPTESA